MTDQFCTQRKLTNQPISVMSNQHGYMYPPGRQQVNSTVVPQHNLVPQHLVNMMPNQNNVPSQSHQPILNLNFNSSGTSQQSSQYNAQMYQMPAFNGTNNSNTNNNMSANNTINNNNFSSPRHQNSNKPKKFYNSENAGHSSSSYPVRLLVNMELVGPLIGRKGEKIKEITVKTGAKIDIKRESVPYSQFGLNQYMFSGCSSNRANNSGDTGFMMRGSNTDGDSQIVFITGDADKCSAAVQEILQLCSEETQNIEGVRNEEPSLGLLVEDRFCARLIGKEGKHLNVVRQQTGCQVHVSNVPTITTLWTQGTTANQFISLDRIISCRGTPLSAMLEAERMISDKVRKCVSEDNQHQPQHRHHSSNSRRPKSTPNSGNHVATSDDQENSQGLSDHNSVINKNAINPSSVALDNSNIASTSANNTTGNNITGTPNSTGHSHNPLSYIGSGIVHKANPNWPDNLKLDENLYVRIPQLCAGSIIGTEGKSVRRIMSETGTYVQVSKVNLSKLESAPAVHTYRKQSITENDDIYTHCQFQRLVTLKGGALNQCSALSHVYNRVRLCYTNSNPNKHFEGKEEPFEVPQINLTNQELKLWIILRIPKSLLGRLIGKDGKVIRQLQHSSRTFLSFPKLESASTDDEKHTNDEVVKSESIPLKKDHKLTETDIEVDLPEEETAGSPNNEITLLNPDGAIFGDDDLHPIEIYGSHECVESAVYMIRRLIYSSIFTQYGPALIPGPMTMLSPHDMMLHHPPPPPGVVSSHHHGPPPHPYYNPMMGMHRSYHHHMMPSILPPLPVPSTNIQGGTGDKPFKPPHPYLLSNMHVGGAWYHPHGLHQVSRRYMQQHQHHRQRRTQSDPRSGERKHKKKTKKDESNGSSSGAGAAAEEEDDDAIAGANTEFQRRAIDTEAGLEMNNSSQMYSMSSSTYFTMSNNSTMCSNDNTKHDETANATFLTAYSHTDNLSDNDINFNPANTSSPKPNINNNNNNKSSRICK